MKDKKVFVQYYLMCHKSDLSSFNILPDQTYVVPSALIMTSIHLKKYYSQNEAMD
jgi:hypothetical protein